MSRPDGAAPDGVGPDGAARREAGPDGAGPDGAGPDGAGPDGAARQEAGPSGWRRSRAVSMVVELAPLALVIVAEAAWISIVAGLLQEFALRDPVIGIPALAISVVAGVVLARLVGPRLGDRWPALAFGLVLVAAAVGCLLSPAARAALGEGIGPAIAEHPGGLLVGLALLRGFAHARLPLDESTVAHVLAIGVPGLALASLLGGVIGDPYRSRFLADALGAAIVYIAATVLALALARLDAVGLDAGFDWRRNPPWLLVTVTMLIGAIVIAIPLSVAAGTIISILVSILFVPLLLIGLASGLDRAARRFLLYVLGASIAIYLIAVRAGSAPTPPTPVAPGAAGPGTPATGEQVVIGLGGLLLLGAVVGIIVLIALWMRRSPPPEGSIGETRTIDPTGDGIAPHRRRSWFDRRPAPRTAVEAYVALVADLDRHADVRREPAETPAAHAARLRSADPTTLPLDLLAADYALARYGGVRLPAREDRRAVGRWRILRRRLTAGRHPIRAEARSGAAPTADGEPPVDLEPRRTF